MSFEKKSYLETRENEDGRINSPMISPSQLNRKYSVDGIILAFVFENSIRLAFILTN